ncbi:MAG: phosphatase PAP2 family protein [Myxococcales bacterium]|nr:phosphatase PAP2 family protein [Myxococcales bacterium]
MFNLTPLFRADARLFELIHIRWHDPWWQTFFNGLTWLGNAAVLLALVLPLLFWIERERFVALSLALGLTLAVGGLSVQALKHTIDRPRPAQHFGERMRLAPGTPRHRGSFPSGHANTVFAAATFLWAIRRGLGGALFSVAFLVGFSRVYVGAHYPADVVAGAALGILVGWIAIKLWKRKMEPDDDADHHPDVQRI